MDAHPPAGIDAASIAAWLAATRVFAAALVARARSHGGLALLFIAIAGCRAQLPSRVFRCTDSGECPAGQRCLVPDNLCVATTDSVWLPSSTQSGATAPSRQPDNAHRATKLDEPAIVDPNEPATEHAKNDESMAETTAGAGAATLNPASPMDANLVADGGATMTTAQPMATPDAASPPATATAPDPTREGFSEDRSLANWPMPSATPGSQTKPNLMVAGNVVIDQVTHLVWERDPPQRYPGCDSPDSINNRKCTWEQARRYCESADLASSLGGSGWRLPTKIELESLIDETRSPALDTTAFANTNLVTSFWTSTPYAGNQEQAWAVSTDTGMSWLKHVTNELNRVRCVR